MQGSDIANLLRVLGMGVVLAAFLVVAWALMADRSRGRRRCPGCWYDMQAIPSRRCPECGREARSEAALHRTYRRWRLAMVALIALPIGYATYCTDRISRSGPIGLAPTTGLVWWVGGHEPAETYRNSTMSTPSKWASELATRVGAHEAWDWQWRWLMHELGAVRGHARWPRDVAYTVSTGVPSWLQKSTRYAFASKLPGAVLSMGDHAFAWEAGVLSEPLTRVGITIAGDGYQMMWELPVTQVASAAESLSPVTDPQVDAAAQRALRASIGAAPNAATQTAYLLGARLYRDEGPLPDDVGMGVMVEFLRDGEVKGAFLLCPLDSPYGEPTDWIRINAPAPGWDEQNAQDIARWQVRIRGDAMTSLRDAKRKRYWAGEYVVPLSEVMR